MTYPGSGPAVPGADGVPPAYGAPSAPGYAPSGYGPVQPGYPQPGHPQPGYGPPQPGYGYGDAPPQPGTALPPGGYPYPGGGYPPTGPWGGPVLPPGLVQIPNGPVLRAATPGQRALARLIDSAGYFVLLAGALALGFYLMFRSIEDTSRVDYSYGYARSTTDEFPYGILWFYGLILAAGLIIVLYESLMIGLTGQTVGGRLMGVRFVRTSDGARPGFGRALGRAAALGASTVVCYGIVFLLLLFSMFFDQQPGRHQSWMDKLCGLQAVTTKDG